MVCSPSFWFTTEKERSLAHPRAGRRPEPIIRRLAVASLFLGLALAACGTDSSGEPGSTSTETTDASSAETTTSGAPTTDAPTTSEGRIVFQRVDDPASEETVIYTVSLDGSDLEELAAGQFGRWSPDGTEISIFCCDDGMAAHIVDVDTGDIRGLEPPDPALETFCGGSWSPDGERLTCEGFGVDDPGANGIYSILATDGGGLTRITTNPSGSYDTPGDYSPDGERLVFMRFEGDRLPTGYFVTNVDGSGQRQIDTGDLILDDSGFAGSWSPDGNNILFVARTGEDRHKAIWIVDADGGTPEQLPIDPVCGGPFSDPGEFGCYSPDWSPDGQRIVFTRSDSSIESIYVVNADGSGVVQVTDGEDDSPHWGTPPA